MSSTVSYSDSFLVSNPDLDRCGSVDINYPVEDLSEWKESMSKVDDKIDEVVAGVAAVGTNENAFDLPIATGVYIQNQLAQPEESPSVASSLIVRHDVEDQQNPFRDFEDKLEPTPVFADAKVISDDDSIGTEIWLETLLIFQLMDCEPVDAFASPNVSPGDDASSKKKYSRKPSDLKPIDYIMPIDGRETVDPYALEPNTSFASRMADNVVTTRGMTMPGCDVHTTTFTMGQSPITVEKTNGEREAWLPVGNNGKVIDSKRSVNISSRDWSGKISHPTPWGERFLVAKSAQQTSRWDSQGSFKSFRQKNGSLSWLPPASTTMRPPESSRKQQLPRKKILHCDVRPADILLGRGIKHPGNILLRELVSANFNNYEATEKRKKIDIVKDIFQFITQKGGRFLKKKREGGHLRWHWEEVDRLTALQKVSSNFRGKRRALHRTQIVNPMEQYV